MPWAPRTEIQLQWLPVSPVRKPWRVRARAPSESRIASTTAAARSAPEPTGKALTSTGHAPPRAGSGETVCVQ